MTLIELITSAKAYLAEFDSEHYEANFARFSQDLAPLLEDLRPEYCEITAAKLVDGLEAGLSKQKFFARRTDREETKQALALFAVPACLKAGETGTALADAIVEQWNARNPRSQFLRGDYETIMRGFESSFLGIPSRKF